LPEPRYYVKTDFWLLERLKADDGRTTIERVVGDATAAIARTRLKPEQKRHAFVAIGWRPAQPRPKPVLVVVSNALGVDLRWVSRAESTFATCIYEMPPSMEFAVREFGQGFNPRERARVERLVARALAHGPICVARTSSMPCKVLLQGTMPWVTALGRDTALGGSGHAWSRCLDAVYTARHSTLR